jgi:Ni/Co efflux regulator RcnB
MRILTLAALAASAAGFAPAMAQTVPDSDYGTPPPAHMRGAPPPGTTWQAPQMQMRGAPPQMGAAPQGMQQQRFVLRRMGPGQNMGQNMGRGMGNGRHVEFRRIQRGGVVPRFWWGPQVQVRNWSMYGFPQPFAGGRWIRYYDDALLIDGDGRVYDERPNWDWDRDGDSWSYDDEGVPVYADGGDYRMDRRDDGYGERYERGDMGPGPQVRQRVYVQQGPMMRPPMGPPGPPMGPPPGGGYGGGYGYGAAYMGYGPVIVTETTVTEAPVVEARTIVSYETVRVVRHHRRHVVRCGCRPAAPPPPPGGGERG